MTGKERMLKTLRFEEPDRAPHFEIMFEPTEQVFGRKMPTGEEWQNARTEGERNKMLKDAMEIYSMIVDRFSWDASRRYRRLIKKENGEFILLAQDTVPYRRGQTYQIEVIAYDKYLEIFIDENLIFEVEDTSFSQGIFALYSWANAGTCFDDIYVEDLDTGLMIFENNFNDPYMDDWVIIDEGSIDYPSAWSIERGTLVQSSNIYSYDFGRWDLSKLGTYLLYSE